jgi:DNA mismatch repair protein MSH6
VCYLQRHELKGNLSVSTTRLLKAILPSACLWTSLRDSEGLGYEKTLKEVKELYPAKVNEDENMDDGDGLGQSVPQGIRDMILYKGAIEALGGMIWYVP